MNSDMLTFIGIIVAAFLAATPGLYAAWVQRKNAREAKQKSAIEISDLADQIEGRVLKRARDELDRILGENEKLHRALDAVSKELDAQRREFIEVKKHYNEVCAILVDVIQGVRELVEQIRALGETPAYEPGKEIEEALARHTKGELSGDV